MGVGVLIIAFSNKRSPNFSSKTTSRGSSLAAIVGLVLGIIYYFVDYNDNYIPNGHCGMGFGVLIALTIAMITTSIYRSVSKITFKK